MELSQNEPTIAEANTLKELNIHLGYIREKMNSNNNERKADMLEIKTRLTEVATNQVSVVDFENVKKDVGDHKAVLAILVQFKDTLIGKMWGIGIGAGVLVSIITFIANHYFK